MHGRNPKDQLFEMALVARQRERMEGWRSETRRLARRRSPISVKIWYAFQLLGDVANQANYPDCHSFGITRRSYLSPGHNQSTPRLNRLRPWF